ncbi:MAG: glycosyltransferase family 9 protein [Geobacter sp.]|nr:glycosyltransferase family 9 protein [Geobacter sp.]
MPERVVLHSGYRFKDRRVILFCRVMDALLSITGTRPRPRPGRIEKILLMKPDHLGDMLMLTAVLPLLKERFPYAAVDVLCGSWSLAVLENNPLVREKIVLDHPAYNRGKASFAGKMRDFHRTLRQALKKLRRERYDLCLNFRDAGGDLILLARLGGCRHIIGHATGGCGPLLDSVVPWEEGRHEVEHYLEVLQPLGIRASVADLRYGLYPTAADEARVENLAAEHGLNMFVVIHPGSGDPRKLRSVDAWTEVIDGVDPSCGVVVTGTADERYLFDAIAARCGRKLVCLMGEVTVAQLFLLFSRSAAVYALDSLAAHLAATAGAKTVVFWSTANDPEQWRPLGSNVTVVLPERS